MHTHSGPGRSEREGVTVFQLFEKFPDETAARAWFEGVRWRQGRYCGHCGSQRTKFVPNEKPMPYWCTACRQYFSIKTGTPMQGSPLPLRKWVVALYLMTTSLKGVSSMKLHRDLGVTQKTAWFMIHRIRLAWGESQHPFTGPVEVDETYIGGKERNKHSHKKTKAGRGPVGKTAVVGMKDRQTNHVKAAVVEATDRATLQGFVTDRLAAQATVYTDEHASYVGLPHHAAVKHSAKQYVDGMAHTNGIESFWALLKRGYRDTYHRMSVKHLFRYVQEFAGRHNVRRLDTLEQMGRLVAGMEGKRLRYQELTA